MKVYVITADADYHSNKPIRAYARRGQAEAFMERVRVHSERRPSPPGQIEGGQRTEQDDVAHDRWWESHEKWLARHPAGKEWATYDRDFTIHELRVIP